MIFKTQITESINPDAKIEIFQGEPVRRELISLTDMMSDSDTKNIIKETPKWLTYKALLSQQGENPPVARVLNQDEPDYLGDIEWTREWNGTYHGSNKHYNNSTITSCISQMINPIDNVGYAFSIESYHANGVEVIISGFDTTTLDTTTSSDNKLLRTPIEIKVRLRGAPPKLLSAETNEAGDKIILTFDKKMSSFMQAVALDYFLLNGDIYGNYAFIIDEINDNKVRINLSEFDSISHEEYNLLLSTNGAYLESFDYGLLQPFENFPVKNNVVA